MNSQIRCQFCIVFIYHQIIQGLQGLTMNNDIDHDHLIIGANK